MIAKVILGTMQNARKLVSIAESIPYDTELCMDRYVVDAKSMLGVLSMPDFEEGELHVHTDDEEICEKVLQQLLDSELLKDTNDSVCRSIYDITASQCRSVGGEIGGAHRISWKSGTGHARGIFTRRAAERKCEH